MNINAISPLEVIKRLNDKVAKQEEQIKSLNETVKELKRIIENDNELDMDNANI